MPIPWTIQGILETAPNLTLSPSQDQGHQCLGVEWLKGAYRSMGVQSPFLTSTNLTVPPSRCDRILTSIRGLTNQMESHWTTSHDASPQTDSTRRKWPNSVRATELTLRSRTLSTWPPKSRKTCVRISASWIRDPATERHTEDPRLWSIERV